MKKLRLAACALACMIAITACDPNDLNGPMGNGTIVISESGVDALAAGDSINFRSSVNDNVMGAEYGLPENIMQSVVVCANFDLTQTIEPRAPYMGWSTNDTVAGEHALSTVFTTQMLCELEGNPLTEANILGIFINDSTYLLSKGGSVNIDVYPTYGNMMQGTISNVSAWYITRAKAEALFHLYQQAQNDAEAAAELAAISLDEYFPTVKFDGNFASRRFDSKSLIQKVLARFF